MEEKQKVVNEKGSKHQISEEELSEMKKKYLESTLEFLENREKGNQTLMEIAGNTQQFCLNKLKEYNLAEYQRYIDLEQEGSDSILQELETVQQHKRRRDDVPEDDRNAKRATTNLDSADRWRQLTESLNMINARFDTLKTEVTNEVKNEVAAVKTEVKSEVAAVKTEVKSEVAALKTEVIAAVDKRIAALQEGETINISTAKSETVRALMENLEFSLITDSPEPREHNAIYQWEPSSESSQASSFLEAFKKSDYWKSIDEKSINIHSNVNNAAKTLEFTFFGMKFTGKPDLLVEAGIGVALEVILGSIELKKECIVGEAPSLPKQLLLQVLGTFMRSKFLTFGILTDGKVGFYAETSLSNDNKLVICWCYTSFAGCVDLMKKFLQKHKTVNEQREEWIQDSRKESVSEFDALQQKKKQFKDSQNKLSVWQNDEDEEKDREEIVGKSYMDQMRRRKAAYDLYESMFFQMNLKEEFGSVDNIIGVVPGWDLPPVNIGPPCGMYL